MSGRRLAKVRGVSELDGKWIARYKIAGKDVRKVFDDRRDAIAHLEKMRTMKRAGEYIPPSAKKPLLTSAERAKQVSAITLGELCDDLKLYIAKHPTQYKDQLNPPRRLDRIKADLGDRPATSIKPRDVEAWLDGLTNRHAQRGEGQPLADASVNRYRVVLSAVYKRGIKNEKVTEIP